MDRRPLSSLITLFAVLGPATVFGGDASRHEILDAGQQPDDVRLQPPKDLDDYFPFEVPSSRPLWEQRQNELKQRVRVATGLWPLPERTPLNAVIHGKVERNGFTMEKVYFESLPGHYVTGMLFRPGESSDTARPGILCPHGHGGRMQDAGPEKIKQQIEKGEEFLEQSGRMPKLARCAQLARMGCVAFMYDMLGYADSHQISFDVAHRYAKPRDGLEGHQDWGFYGVQAELRLHSIMNVQTWNGLRALDFLESLPDTDPQKLAVTGNSGGGTQTILLGALDDRPIAAYPNGMVSTAMQGGCTCENCSLLRVGTGNVELAALFAPRPQAMTAVNDWTRDMMSKGYPELKRLYTMLGVTDDVDCVEMLHMPHNFNAVTRQLMYSWMNRHLELGLKEPIEETDWPLFSEEEAAMWTDEHPAPPSGVDYERKLLQQLDERDRAVLFDHSPGAGDQTTDYLRIIGTAWNTIIDRDLPASSDIQRTKIWKEERAGYLEFGDLLTLTSHGEQLPVISLYPQTTEWNSEVVLWVDGDGKSGLFSGDGLHPDVDRLMRAGYAVVAADLCGQGEFTTNRQTRNENPRVKNPRTYAGYTYTYNNTLFVQRVHDILTLTAWITSDEHSPDALHAVGTNGGGALLAAARPVAGDKLRNVAVVANGFRFADLTRWQDAQFVPGAVKYGDLPGLLMLSAPHPMWVDETPIGHVAAAWNDSRGMTFGNGGGVDQAVSWLLMQ